MLKPWLEFVEAHPHDFTIQYPPRREYFQRHFRRPPSSRFFHGVDRLLLYAHIPFCEARCHYCNFSVNAGAAPGEQRAYASAVIEELANDPRLPGTEVGGIDVGGGTPTSLPIEQLQRILAALDRFRGPSPSRSSLSMETTPRIAAEEPEKIHALVAGGVDRISLGVQSFDDRTLIAVNRQAQLRRTERAVANLRRARVPRLNLDVIFGLPGQTLRSWRRGLGCLRALAPDSITTYDCLYRGKGRAMTRPAAIRPSMDLYGRMYDLAYATLTAAGYHAPYGSLNFSRRAGETGTSAYFEKRMLDGWPYRGVGAGATSLQGNFWSFNFCGLRIYEQRIRGGRSPIEYFYRLPVAEMRAKYVLSSLNFGVVDERRFERRFADSFRRCYEPELDLALTHGWLVQDGRLWKVASHEFRSMHRIRALFYPPNARRWLLSLYRTS